MCIVYQTIDRKGKKSSLNEAARIAANVYGDKKENILIGGWVVSRRYFGIKLSNDKTRLNSNIYERTKNGKTEYAYVFAGTADKQDIKEDVLQSQGGNHLNI